MKSKLVTEPVLKFENGNDTISLWAYDAGEHVHFTGFTRNGLTYGGEKTAGLVYERQGSTHTADEYNLRPNEGRPSLWPWIQKWMGQAFKVFGYAKGSPKNDQFKVVMMDAPIMPETTDRVQISWEDKAVWNEHGKWYLTRERAQMLCAELAKALYPERD